MASQALPASSASGFSRDFAASIVVFLVAMPLCMGIAVASGLPPEKGLMTGIIGGLVVGMIAGSPLQVSGPAAGLAVIVKSEEHTSEPQSLMRISYAVFCLKKKKQ